jgi:Fe2+ transport system protein FeoA
MDLNLDERTIEGAGNEIMRKTRHRYLHSQLTLADIPPGMRVRILSMDSLSVERRDHLLAFGMAPGQWVEIKQHHPAVVAQVDYTELALEPEVASHILVTGPFPIRRLRHHRHGGFGRRRRYLRRFFRHQGRRRSFRSRFPFWHSRRGE